MDNIKDFCSSCACHQEFINTGEIEEYEFYNEDSDEFYIEHYEVHECSVCGFRMERRLF